MPDNPPKIIVLSTYSDDISEIGQLTTPNKVDYCNRYGYSYLIKQTPNQIYDSSNIVTNNILQYKFNLLNDGLYSKADWILWIDNDALFMNHTIPLTNLIDNNYEFIIGEDWNGINAGVFLLKNCNNAIKFLNALWTYIPSEYDKLHTPFWWYPSEQAAMFRNLHLIKSKIIHHSLINGYIIGPRPDNDWRNRGLSSINPNWQERRFIPGDFILHFVGEFNANRIKQIKRYLQIVIK